MTRENVEKLMDAWFLLRDAKEETKEPEAHEEIRAIMERLHILIDGELEKLDKQKEEAVA